MQARMGCPGWVRSRWWRWLTSVGAALTLVAGLAPGTQAASGVKQSPGAVKGPRVPEGFVGMFADGPLFDPRVDLAQQMDKMVASGVENLRVVFSWSAAQPYASWSAVPAPLVGVFSRIAGGVPTDFSASDQIVGLAAERGLSVLPVPLYAPSWDLETNPPRWSADPVDWPIQPHLVQPYADYLTALVDRYGPHGSFWTQNPQIPRRPIRQWQIWNEPNLDYFWASEPFAPSYVALLRAAHAAIKRADPGAEVVLAGLANNSWGALGQIYQQPDARSLFDAVAIHPYTAQPAGVIKILHLVRGVMATHGDGAKPLLVTELGWPSSQGHTPNTFGLATTRSGQARKLAAAIPMLAQARNQLHLAGFDVYTWMGTEGAGSNTFSYSGLFAFDPTTGAINVKPAYSAFRRAALALEHCRVKSSVATACVRST